MGRLIGHFSCGAASAVACKLAAPDEIWYAATGSEDHDNERFMRDCESWLGKEVRILRSENYKSTWDVWEKKRYISGIHGAPCTGELKVLPQIREQMADDTHVFGYTADANDMRRADTMREMYPDLKVSFPLIERGINKAACLALLNSVGIEPPRIYALGFSNANCIPCCKATSPSYWALVRKHFPDEFNRMAKLSRELCVTLTRLKGDRAYIDEIPIDHPVTDPITPACDMLCMLAETDLLK